MELQKIRRIFISRYTQLTQGDDTEFRLWLGAPILARTVSIDFCSTQNLFSNFYQSQTEDFTDGRFQYQIGNGAIITVNMTVDQYLSSLDLHNFLNDQIPTLFFGQNDISAYKKNINMRVAIRNNNTFATNLSSFIPLGAFWKKLGFDLGIDSISITNGQSFIRGAHVYDFQSSSVVLAEIRQLTTNSGQIQNQFGSCQVSIPVRGASFGETIFYENQQQKSNMLVSDQPFNLSYLDIRLLGMDQKILKTVRSNSQSNQNGLDFVMILSVTE